MNQLRFLELGCLYLFESEIHSIYWYAMCGLLLITFAKPEGPQDIFRKKQVRKLLLDCSTTFGCLCRSICLSALHVFKGRAGNIPRKGQRPKEGGFEMYSSCWINPPLCAQKRSFWSMMTSHVVSSNCTCST